MTIRRLAFYVISVGLMSLLDVSVTLAGIPKNLQDLECVDILVEDLDDKGQEAGLSMEHLENTLLVAVKAKAPRLRISDECEEILYLNITAFRARLEDGRSVGSTAFVRLEVQRMVTIKKTGTLAFGGVWSASEILSIPGDSGKQRVEVSIDQSVTAFAADYYKAGNP